MIDWQNIKTVKTIDSKFIYCQLLNLKTIIKVHIGLSKIWTTTPIGNYSPILLKSSRINTRIADCETMRYSTFSTLISMDALFKYSA